MSKSWNTGLTILAAVLIVLFLCGSLRFANVLLYRIGRIGIIAVLAMLVYGFVRKKG